MPLLRAPVVAQPRLHTNTGAARPRRNRRPWRRFPTASTAATAGRGGGRAESGTAAQ